MELTHILNCSFGQEQMSKSHDSVFPLELGEPVYPIRVVSFLFLSKKNFFCIDDHLEEMGLKKNWL